MDASIDTADFPALSIARSHWGRGARHAALDAFRTAVSEKPDNLKALIETARALGALYQISEAETLLARAEQLAKDRASFLVTIASTYGRIHRETYAIDMLLALDPRLPAAKAELAALLEKAGRLTEARTEIEACIAAAPRAHEPRLAHARILRRMGEHAMARTALKALTSPNLPAALRAEAFSECGYIAIREGKESAASAALVEANAILRALPGTDDLIARSRANNRLVASLACDLSRDKIAGWQSDARDHPTVVGHLLGFPRSGTTLLEQWLDAHPGLVASAERAHFTINILPDLAAAGGGLGLAQLETLPERILADARTKYLEGMEQALGEPLAGRVHLDKNPNLTGLIPVLLRLFPYSRFVVALRDPRDVVTSCVLRSFRLTEFSAMLLDWGTAVELYAAEMGAWLLMRQAIPHAHWIETRYEDMVANPRVEVTRVLDALGLGWHEDVAKWQSRTQGRILNSPTQTEARQPVYGRAVGRWRAHRAALAPHLDRLMPFVEAFGYPTD